MKQKDRILFIDDELSSCIYLIRYLEMTGEYEILLASDVGTAIERLRNDSIDLIITDVMMPPGPFSKDESRYGMFTGLVLISHLRRGDFKIGAQSTNPEVPVLFHSVMRKDDMPTSSSNVGYLSKIDNFEAKAAKIRKSFGR